MLCLNIIKVYLEIWNQRLLWISINVWKTFLWNSVFLWFAMHFAHSTNNYQHCILIGVCILWKSDILRVQNIKNNSCSFEFPVLLITALGIWKILSYLEQVSFYVIVSSPSDAHKFYVLIIIFATLKFGKIVMTYFASDMYFYGRRTSMIQNYLTW